MSAEDRLRNLLHNEADSIAPTGDGLARIQERIARRRRLRRWVVPSAAIATGALAAAIFLIAPNDDHKDVLQPAGTPTPSAAPSNQPSPSTEPTASPTVAPPPPNDSYTGPAIWPYTSQAQADGWTVASTPWAQSGLTVTQHFVTDYLGLTGVTVTQPCASCAVFGLEVSGKSVGTVAVAHYIVGNTQVFTVVSVGGTDLTITSPTSGQAVTSPTAVTGRIVGVDENVALRLLATDGRELASTGAPAGSAVPWQGTLTWTTRDWSTAGIVGVTRSAMDGSVNRIVAVPVTRG